MKFNLELGEILTKSWKITWKFKVLWIFGILSGCVANNRRSLNFNSSSWRNTSSNGLSGNGQLPDFLRPFQKLNFEQALGQFFQQYLGLIALVIVLLCVLWFVFYFLGLVGKIGLIKGVSKADAGAERLGFGELWSESQPYFWRMFALSLMIGLPAFLVTILMLAAIGLGVYSAIAGSLPPNSLAALMIGLVGGSVLLLCCLSLVMLVVGLIVEQAENAIIIEDRRLLDGLGRGWEVFKKNWLAVIIVGVLQAVIGFIIGIVELFVNLIILLPMLIVVIWMAVNQVSLAAETGRGMLIALLLTLSCTAVILIPFSLWFNGLQQTYFQAMWTLTYRRLTAEAGPQLPAQVELIQPE